MEVGKAGVLPLYTAAVPEVSPPERRAEQYQLIQAVRSVNKAQVFGEYNELQFSRDRVTGTPIMKIVDKRTQEVIRQIPPEYVLRLAEDLEVRME